MIMSSPDQVSLDVVVVNVDWMTASSQLQTQQQQQSQLLRLEHGCALLWLWPESWWTVSGEYHHYHHPWCLHQISPRLISFHTEPEL